MNDLHNELLKKVDVCGRSSATALQNVWVGDDNDEFLASEADEDSEQPLTIVDDQTAGDFSSFTQEEVRLGASLIPLCFLT